MLFQVVYCGFKGGINGDSAAHLTFDSIMCEVMIHRVKYGTM